MGPREKIQRVIAIDPTSRGFGFVVLEGPTALVDWGVKEIPGNGADAAVAKVADLIDLYQPSILVVEDCNNSGSRRRSRVRDLLGALVELADRMQIRTVSISVAEVRRTFDGNKHQIAQAVANRLPDLARCLPPPRKPWMSEDERMAIFDAAAFALTWFEAGSLRKHAA